MLITACRVWQNLSTRRGGGSATGGGATGDGGTGDSRVGGSAADARHGGWQRKGWWHDRRRRRLSTEDPTTNVRWWDGQLAGAVDGGAMGGGSTDSYKTGHRTP